jgi:hypothetical protein
MPKSPVFIVGSPRSGTSILVSALSGVGYQGYREGNFLPLMQFIISAIDLHFATFAKPNPHILVAQIDPQLLKKRVELLFKEITDNLNPAPLWFDKSGNHGMITAIPTLLRLWPTSVFIFAKRRAIENIVSRIKKFPERHFEYHCLDWARNMAAWREVREKLPVDIYLEVDQQDLIRDTEAISSKIATFLGLENQQLEILTRTFRSRRPQETNKGSASKTYSLEGLHWSEAKLAIFRKHCAPEMDAFGYGEGEEYYRDPQQ